MHFFKKNAEDAANNQLTCLNDWKEYPPLFQCKFFKCIVMELKCPVQKTVATGVETGGNNMQTRTEMVTKCS